jgi:hypothetical protein
MNDDDHDERSCQCAGAFAGFAALVTTIADPATYDAAMADFRRRLAAVKRGEASIVARRDRLEVLKQAQLAAYEKEHADLSRRLDVALAAKPGYEERRHRIFELTMAWRVVGEDADVQRGLKSPRFSALEKALSAHGIQPSQADVDPSHGRPTDDEFGVEPAPHVSAGSSLTHRRERSMRRVEA